MSVVRPHYAPVTADNQEESDPSAGEKWDAKICRKGKEYLLGFFDDELEAARARKALELHGKYARLNLSHEFYPGYLATDATPDTDDRKP